MPIEDMPLAQLVVAFATYFTGLGEVLLFNGDVTVTVPAPANVVMNAVTQIKK